MALTQIKGEGLVSTYAIGSEGGAVTTSIQQGVAKAWFYLNQTGTQSLIDSLNCSSITDIAAGQSQVSFSSSFSNINWAAGAVGGGSADDVVLQKYSTSYWGTGSTDWFNHDVYTGFVDSAYGTSIITGDLA